MQRLEFSGAVRPIYGSLGVKRSAWRDMKNLVLTEFRTTNLQILYRLSYPGEFEIMLLMAFDM